MHNSIIFTLGVKSEQCERESLFAGFEVITAVVVKSSVFWYITLCSPLKVNRRFRGFHLLSRWFLAWLMLRHRRWRRRVSPKRRLTFNAIRGAISEKSELFSKVFCPR
jgi:hypothetical protein